MSVSLKILSEPVSYNEFSSYRKLRKEIKATAQQDQYRKYVIIFGLAWIAGDKEFNFLSACTSKGEIVVWRVPTGSSDEKNGIDCSRPIFRQKISQGKLYSIKVEKVGTKRLLIVNGDDGVSVFDWEADVLKTHLQHNISKSEEPKLSPAIQFRPHPSPLESRGIEVNDVQVLQGDKNNYLFGAAGDSFGVYKWDLETGKLLSNYKSPGSGYLHSIQLVPANEGNRPSTLLAGGEGGRLEFWDVNQDKSMGQIDLTTVSAADASSASTDTTARANPSKRAKTTSRWISSICPYDANWFSVAGGSGAGGYRGSSGGMSGNGFVATYHQPTRSLVSWVDTRETPQQLAVLPSAMESSVQHSLISVANEGVVSHFNALSLDITRRQWCSPPSAYAAAVSKDGQHSAIGGVGCLVDVFDSAGDKSIQLSIC